MMRFQRVSPDYLPFTNGNGKKSNSNTCKEKEREEGKEDGFDCEGVKALRFRSPSKTQTHDSSNANSNSHSPPLSHLENNNKESQSQRQRLDGVGDVLLQWGQKKRARLSRTEIRSLSLPVTHHSSSSSSYIHKLQRRGSPFLDKLASPAPLPANATSATRPSATLRTKETSGFIPNTSRNLEDRSAAAANASPSRNTTASNTPRAVSRSTVAKTSPPDKIASRKDEKPNGSLTRPDHNTHLDSASLHLHQEPTNTASMAVAMAGGGGEKMNIEVIEWPKIYVALSRKEKEDDFLAMRGTKLPQRPKKRAKNIDRALQYCFPGMWLSDLTKSRYEVREKKSVKKQKRKGLKGMESVDSDSE